LSRPSTSGFAAKKDVDCRVKPGNDEGGSMSTGAGMTPDH
jgi:hypothetical protein